MIYYYDESTLLDKYIISSSHNKIALKPFLWVMLSPVVLSYNWQTSE